MGEIPGQSLHQAATASTGRGRQAGSRQAGDRQANHRHPGADQVTGLWDVRHRDPGVDGLPGDLLSQMDGGALPSGIERRLPRRAEVLWSRLKGEADLPPAQAAGALLAPPFSTQALLVTKPQRGRPQIAYAGSEISWLGPAGVGPAVADSRPSAPIPQRLAALALAAIAAGAPRHLDSDFDPDTAGLRPGILFRAVALPLAADPASGLSGLAVAVLSWRKLLSQQETDALHSELQAAIGWLGSTGRSGPAR
jgi:hypothetical protein